MNHQSQPSPRAGSPEQISGINPGSSGWRGQNFWWQLRPEMDSEELPVWILCEKHTDTRNWMTTFTFKVEL